MERAGKLRRVIVNPPLTAAPQWCKVVHMVRSKRRVKRRVEEKPVTGKAQRVSVSFTVEQYAFLAQLAERKRVSIAWVIRDAVDKLVSEETPLFRGVQP